MRSNNAHFMQSEGHERRKEHSRDEEFQGLAGRSLREGVPVDKLELRLRNPDESAGPDAERVNELRAGAKGKLLAMAGLTPEQVTAVLKSVKEGGGSTRVLGAEPEAASTSEKVLSTDQKASLFSTFETSFASAARSKDIAWADIKSALEAAGDKALYGLFQMEDNGHEVGVVRAEKDGKKGLRFDSCSSESPTIRDVDYFEAERIAKSDWGVSLMEREIFEELRHAGVIKNRNSWDHLKTANPGTKEKPGRSIYGHNGGFNRDNDASNHDPHGGFRCSLWVPEA